MWAVQWNPNEAHFKVEFVSEMLKRNMINITDGGNISYIPIAIFSNPEEAMKFADEFEPKLIKLK